MIPDLAAGAQAAEDILRTVARIDVAKALDPLKPGDFDVIVARLRRAMSRATAKTEAEVLTAAVNALDVDWGNLTAAGRTKIIRAAAATLSKIPPRVIPPLETTLTIAGQRIQQSTRKAVVRSLSATFRSRIGIALSDQDKRIITHAAGSQAHYITDQWGRRRLAWSRIARETVAEGLEQGLGREEIAGMLHARLGVKAGARATRNYYEVVASVYAGRARSYANAASFADAGIERYVFEAVMDERTTDQCAFLNGRIFETSHTLDLFDRVADSTDPEAVKDIQPWLRAGRGPDGERVLFTQDTAGNRTHVCNVVQSRVGLLDAPGKFSQAKSTADLQAMGLCMPPLHARCRSTIVADV